jgi:hypothetical protein
VNKKPLASEEVTACAIALLAACILAANRIGGGGLVGWLGGYAYWIARIAIETALFFMVLVVMEKYLSDRWSQWWILVLACVVSLVPFTLAITTFDLILGLPELGFNASGGSSEVGFSAFMKELVYLSDNHLALCALIMLPRYLASRVPEQLPGESDGLADALNRSPNTATTPQPNTFFSTIDPPLSGRIIWIEAQEHYIRINTENESRMVLHRFADAIRELPASAGMQVHRSHWVCFADIKALNREGQRLKLLLSSGDYVPVSRSYRQQVEESFQSLAGKVNP